MKQKARGSPAEDRPALSAPIPHPATRASETATLAVDAARVLRRAGVLQGSGNLAVEHRPVQGFERVRLTGTGSAIIAQGEQESLTVQGDDNLIGFVTSKVEDGTLFIGYAAGPEDRVIEPSEPIRVYLSVKEMTGLDVVGVWDIGIASLDTRRLELATRGFASVDGCQLVTEELIVTLSGLSRVEMAGRVGTQHVEIVGIGDYCATELENGSARVDVNGVGGVSLRATGTLDVGLFGWDGRGSIV
jgi:hypothetical protein